MEEKRRRQKTRATTLNNINEELTKKIPKRLVKEKVSYCSERKGRHKFPKDRTRLMQWIIAIRRPNFIPSKHSSVCIKRFNPDDYAIPKEPTTENRDVPVNTEEEKQGRNKNKAVSNYVSNESNEEPPRKTRKGSAKTKGDATEKTVREKKERKRNKTVLDDTSIGSNEEPPSKTVREKKERKRNKTVLDDTSIGSNEEPPSKTVREKKERKRNKTVLDDTSIGSNEEPPSKTVLDDTSIGSNEEPPSKTVLDDTSIGSNEEPPSKTSKGSDIQKGGGTVETVQDKKGRKKNKTVSDNNSNGSNEEPARKTRKESAMDEGDVTENTVHDKKGRKKNKTVSDNNSNEEPVSKNRKGSDMDEGDVTDNTVQVKKGRKKNKTVSDNNSNGSNEEPARKTRKESDIDEGDVTDNTVQVKKGRKKNKTVSDNNSNGSSEEPPSKVHKGSAKINDVATVNVVEEKKGRKVQKVVKSNNDEKFNNDEPPSKSRKGPIKEKALPSKKKEPLKNKAQTNFSELDFSNTSKNPDGKDWNLKIASWNVDGIRAWMNKGCLEYIEYEKPDIMCLQEVKCSKDKLPEEIANIPGYHAYWLCSEKDGYAGVGIYTTKLAISLKYGLGDEKLDDEGRIITAEYEHFYLISTYVPNAGRKLVTLDKRLEWNAAFLNHVKELDKKKPVIICGDMNVAHNEIDLANPKSNKKNAGFTPEERAGMTNLLDAGFVDTYRHNNPDKTGAYTFWTYMMNSRAKNVGWRLDYMLVSQRLLPAVCDSVIRSEVYGSDHCPIALFLHLNGAASPRE